MTALDERRMLRAGPAFVALTVLAAITGRPFGHLPAPAVVERTLAEHRLRILAGTWLESVSASLLIIYSVGLGSRLRREDAPGAGLLGSLGLVGGTTTGALLLCRAAATAAAAERVGSDGSRADLVTQAIDYGNLLIGKMAPMSLALLTGATAVSGRRSGLLTPWMVRVTAGLTAGLLSPVNFVFIAPGLAWTGVVGWALSRERTAIDEPGEIELEGP